MNKVIKFLDSTFLDLGRQFKWTYLPPLMVYMAAGISGLTGIVGTFFVKDYLNLSAAFLAGLGFWAGIPWALKMPLSKAYAYTIKMMTLNMMAMDAKEGISAFLEKRKPKWKNK